MTNAERNAKWPYRVIYTTAYGESGTCCTTKEEGMKIARKVVHGYMRGKRHTAGQSTLTVMVYHMDESFGFRVIARYRVSKDCGWQ